MPTRTRIPAGTRSSPLDLIEVAGIVVIDGGPEERGQVAELGVRRGVYRTQLVHGIGGKIRKEATREHFLARRGDEVEVVKGHGNFEGNRIGGAFPFGNSFTQPSCASAREACAA